MKEDKDKVVYTSKLLYSEYDTYNADGGKVSVDFHKLVDGFIKECSDKFDTIQLEHILTDAVKQEMLFSRHIKSIKKRMLSNKGE